MGHVVDLTVALRCAVLERYPEYDMRASGVLDELATAADQAFADLEEERVLSERAVILLWRTSTPVVPDAQRARIEIALGDDDALEWVAAQMRELAPRFDKSLELMLDPAHERLLPALSEAGLEPRLTSLHGSPRRALDGLRSGTLDPSWLGDMRLEPLTTDRQIADVCALLPKIFRAQPQFGYLSPAIVITPELQRRFDVFTDENLRKCRDQDAAFVVVRGDEVLGQGGVHLQQDAALGRVAGINIGIAPEIQGRGIGKLLYERLLVRMVELDVAVLRGRTANPKVLHLAKRMGRSVRGWQLEPRGSSS